MQSETTMSRNAPRLEGGKRLNLIQARLNDGERDRLDRIKAELGMTDSAVIRTALARLERACADPGVAADREA